MLRSGDSVPSGEGSPGHGKRSRRRNVALGLLLAVLGGGLVYGIFVATSQAGSVEKTIAGAQPLPDGTTVRVEKVTFGRTHRLGSPPNRFPWLPAWITGSDPNEPTIEFGSSEDTLMLWITHRHPAVPRRTLGLEWWTDYHLTDSHGCRFDTYSRQRRTQGKMSSNSSSIGRGDRFDTLTSTEANPLAVGIMELESFPRREPEMTLQLFGADWGKAAAFRVANPVPGMHPEWTPLPLPQKQSDGDLTVELENVEAAVDTWKDNGVETRQQHMRPNFQVFQAGKRTDKWRADDLRVADATGNEVYAYDCRLCVREQAWKLRARFWRTPEAAFTPDETWVVSNVPVQAPNKILALSGSATRKSVKLELLAIAGRGSFLYKDGVPSVGEQPLPPSHSDQDMSTSGSTSSGPSGRHTESNLRAGLPHVGVRVTGMPEEYHLSLLAIDDRGRRIPSELNAGMDSERYLGLDLPKDARTLTLRFMVHRCRTMEYLIRPPEFKPRRRG